VNCWIYVSIRIRVHVGDKERTILTSSILGKERIKFVQNNSMGWQILTSPLSSIIYLSFLWSFQKQFSYLHSYLYFCKIGSWNVLKLCNLHHSSNNPAQGPGESVVPLGLSVHSVVLPNISPKQKQKLFTTICHTVSDHYKEAVLIGKRTFDLHFFKLLTLFWMLS